jgi:hypothetical protein
MHRLLALLVIALLAPVVSAQSLAHCLPKDTLLYFRQNDPISGMNKFMGNSTIWNRPMDLNSVLGQMDEGLGMMNDMLGFQPGSISTWLRSISRFEGAITRFQLTDGAPEIDFVLVLTTPQAEQIYGVVTGKLLEEQLGTKVADDEMEVGLEDFGINIGRRGEQLIIASSGDRLREIMKVYGSSVQDSLSQLPQFQQSIKGDGSATCLYLRIDAVLKMLRDEGVFNRAGLGFGMRSRGGPGGGRESGPPGMNRNTMLLRMAENLGLFQIATLGWLEGDDSTKVHIDASADIPLFDIFSSEAGGPELLGMLPADTALGFTFHGDLETMYRKAAAVFLDAKKNPFAGFLIEGIAQVQRETGLKIEEMLALHKSGFVVAFLPDENGRMRMDRGEGLLIMARINDKALARDTITKLLEIRMKRGAPKNEVVVREDGDTVFFEFEEEQSSYETEVAVPVPSETNAGDVEVRVNRPTRRNSSRIKRTLALSGEWLAFGQMDAIEKVVLLRKGQYPSLATTGALKNLKAGGTAYFYAGLKGLFGQQRQFAAALSSLCDGAGLTASMHITPKTFDVLTSPAFSTAVMAFSTADAMYEAQSDERERARKDLATIAKAWREFKGLQGKTPTGVDQLGLTGEKAVAFPPSRPPTDPGKAYELVPACEPTDGLSETEIIIATAPDTSLGRIVALMDGSTAIWSEARYREQVAKQKKLLAATK